MPAEVNSMRMSAKAPSISISEISETYFDQVLVLFGECFGKGYVTPAQVGEYLDASDGSRKGFVALVDGKAVGAVTCQIVSSEQLQGIFRMPPGGLKALLAEVGAARKIGLVKSIAVAEKCRRRGIGRTLLVSAVEWLRKQGAEAMLAAAWVSNGVCNARSILEACGFREIVRIEEFWYLDSLRRGYCCPNCGNPCRCAAIIFAA